MNTFPIPINSINAEAYSFTLQYLGLKEIKGKDDDRMIVVAHKLTGVMSEDVDSIPWCSSWVNLAVLCACIRTNPGATVEQMRLRGLSESIIRECFIFAGVNFRRASEFTGRAIFLPTWSSASRSWDTWGVTIPIEEARRGDLIRIVREGGGHIAFLDEDYAGTAFLKLLGANQKDQICSMNFSRTRLVTVRRATL